MVNVNVLQRIGLGRNVGGDTGGAVFRIQKVNIVRSSEECFLGMTPMGYNCRFEKGGVRKGPAVWPRVQ